MESQEAGNQWKSYYLPLLFSDGRTEPMAAGSFPVGQRDVIQDSNPHPDLSRVTCHHTLGVQRQS